MWLSGLVKTLKNAFFIFVFKKLLYVVADSCSKITIKVILNNILNQLENREKYDLTY